MAFTIPQLLVYTAASGILLAATTTTLLSNIRTNSNMELYQRAEERWSRISSLIQLEASEANAVLYNQSVACGGVSGGAGPRSLFSLQIPYLREDNITETSTLIHYYTTGSGTTARIRRCGRPYVQNGKLRTDVNVVPTDAIVGLKSEISLEPSLATAESFEFTMKFYTAGNQSVFSRKSTATVGVEPVCPDSPLACSP
jgi:hypothetical protein